jgi:subtilisin family serine protease
MQSIKTVRGLLVLLVFISGSAGASQRAEIDDSVHEALRRNGQAMVLVKLKAPAGRSLKAALPEERIRQIQRGQNAVLSELSVQDFHLRYRYQTVPGFSGTLFESGLRKLEQHPEVENITIDMEGHGGLLESVPAIQADLAHNLGFTGEGVNVGVLDSGVDLNHLDLRNDIVYQYHFLNRGAEVGSGAQDLHGHGSNVTGIITSEGVIAPTGVAPRLNHAHSLFVASSGSGHALDLRPLGPGSKTVGVRIPACRRASDYF